MIPFVRFISYSIILFFLLFNPSQKIQAETLDFFKKKGIGFAQTNGGIQGLALNYGISKIIWTELIAGGSFIQEESRNLQYRLGGAIGMHIQLIQAKDKAFLSLGLRWNTALGVLSDEINCKTADKICSLQNHAIDLPFRIYWFAMSNLSIFSEFGLSLQFSNEKESRLFGSAPKSGYQLDFFQNRLPFGLLGMTLWF